jgi:hypothetical protein
MSVSGWSLCSFRGLGSDALVSSRKPTDLPVGISSLSHGRLICCRNLSRTLSRWKRYGGIVVRVVIVPVKPARLPGLDMVAEASEVRRRELEEREGNWVIPALGPLTSMVMTMVMPPFGRDLAGRSAALTGKPVRSMEPGRGPTRPP